MSTKKKAIRVLLILVGILLACLFFARTAQTVTTAKVKKLAATRGKLEDRIRVRGEIRFSDSEPFTISGARKLKLTVDKVMARPGYLIKEGDSLFTASIPGYEDALAEIRTKYEAKIAERTQEVASKMRLPQTTPHNEYYNSVLKLTDAYWDKLFEAKKLAMRDGQELPDDVSEWGNFSTPQAGLKAAVQAAYDAKIAMDEANEELKKIYTGGSKIVRTPLGTFEYIVKIDKFSEEIYDLLNEMLELERQKLQLENIKAVRGGWLTEFSLKAGDGYDGSKPAYSLSAAGENPLLRCDITDVKKTITQGMKARVEGSDRELTISGIETSAGGKTYAVIELDETVLSALGGLSKLMGEEELKVDILYKAQRTTTLLPASALRSEDDGQYYIYAIQQSRDGVMGNSTYTVKKQSVTVIDTSAKLVALEDDLSAVQVADGEDRPLRDGQAVMEYVN